MTPRTRPQPSFGEMLRGFRQRRMLTQGELGRRAGLSMKAIGALERGERLLPHPSTIRALIEALHLTESEGAALFASVERSGGPVDPYLPDRASAGESQRAVAWELFVELVTRIAVVELPPDQGLMRDALTSLHSLFDTTRAILRRHGPSVLDTSESGVPNVGGVAFALLNDEVRPFLTAWHPALLDHESRRPAGISPAAHERAWERAVELREALSRLRATLDIRARELAAAAGVRTPPV